jgi:hypothetical protein
VFSCFYPLSKLTEYLVSPKIKVAIIFPNLVETQMLFKPEFSPPEIRSIFNSHKKAEME